MRALALAMFSAASLSAQASWVEISAKSLNRVRAPIVYDATTDVVWSFGGATFGRPTTNETRLFGGGMWVELPTATTPTGRACHGMAFDSVRNRVVMFGGMDANLGTLGDTWEFDGIDWSHVSTTGPAPRARMAFAYDAARGVTVLYGGASGGLEFEDTWEWDGVSWTQATPLSTPGERDGPVAVFDAGLGEIVLYGGVDTVFAAGPFPIVSYVYPPEPWRFDGASWSIAGPGLPGRENHGLAYDPSTASLHVIGGPQSAHSDEHFVLQSGSWTQAQSTPLNTQYVAAVYAGSSVGILATGSAQFVPETLRWTGTAWEGVPASWPDARGGHGMTTDYARQRVVLFGGVNVSVEYGDTWEWNGASWGEHAIGTSPGGRSNHTLTYHSASGESVLFGGRTGPMLSPVADTRTWDGTVWQDPDPAFEPPARFWHAAADDSSRGCVVVFGGSVPIPGGGGASVSTDATWEWDGSAWQQVIAPISPPPRRHHAMAFDPTRGTVVMFGGQTSSWGDDTWEFDGASWSLLSVVAPPPLQYPQLGWDPVRARLVLHGFDSMLPLSLSTWELIGAVWTQRDSDPASGHGKLAFDPVLQRMVGFGGRLFSADSVMWSFGPDAPAEAESIGAGCLGSAGLALMTTASSLPWIDDTFVIVVQDAAPAAVPFLAFGFSDQVWNGLSLPIDLSSLGAPACTVWTALEVLQPVAGVAPAWQIGIPNDSMLLGSITFAQALALDGVNPLGLVTANALKLTIGGR